MDCEILAPGVAPGIEQANGFARSIPPRDIASFVRIAQDARIRQIAEAGETTVFATDDVIDLVWKAAAILVDQAVFTTVAGPLDTILRFLSPMSRATKDLARLGAESPHT